MSKFLSSVVSAVCLCVPLASAHSANLIINGSFEIPVALGQYQTGVAPANWTVSPSAATIDLIKTYWQPHADLQSVDLFGFDSQSSLSQSFATTVGNTYQVTYYQSENPDYVDPTRTISVGINGSPTFSSDFTNPTPTYSNMQWQMFTFNFVANSALTLLSFSGQSSDGNNHSFGPALDSVSVTDLTVSAIPEPGEWAMMIAGLGAIGLMVRRRRAN